MKKRHKIFFFFFFFFFFSLLISPLYAQNAKLTIDLAKKGVKISKAHYGIFFEDINHAADGGLYAELIRNRSFEDASTPDSWTTFNKGGTQVYAAVETAELLNSNQSQALKLNILSDGKLTSRAGVQNSGFWGINIVDGQQYKLSFFAKCDSRYTGNVVVSLDDAIHVYAKDSISSLSTEWKKYTLTLTAAGSNPKGMFSISFNVTGSVWLDVVSLFPPTFKNRENGMRSDLAQMLADMHPKFFRFPGGCFVEGDVLTNRYQWKKSIGSIEERPGHWNLWGYRATDGIGYHEYLQLSEDIGAEPLFVVNVGLAHNDYQPVNDLDGYIQDALDAIEYANGDVSTTYGAMRAANGHPKPFNLKYIEIGNENYHGNSYGERYAKFYNAIKAKDRSIQCIGNVAAWGTDTPAWTFSYPVDIIDEHYYRSPQWFIEQYRKYDSYSRTGPKVYVGEYAVTSECGLGNQIAALGEAVYMCGMEKNSDIVTMNSYAPIFVNTNDRKWNPDMIVFDASVSYGTPSYHVQNLFSNSIGTVDIQVEDSANVLQNPILGRVGLGSWSTSVQYSNINILSDKNEILFSDNFANSEQWSALSGNWNTSSNIYNQTSTATDCRSVTAVVVSDTAYTYTVRAKKTSGNEGFLIIFGYEDSNNFFWWNIGGWNNTRNAIEKCTNGSKTVVSDVSGSVQAGVWYDIKIEITKDKVSCYLNNVLIQTYTNAGKEQLYYSSSLDEMNNMLYLKVVNPSNKAIASTLKFNGLQTDNTISGIVTTLASSSGLDENSFAEPNKIAPITTGIFSDKTNIDYLFAPYSLAVFKIDTKITNPVPVIKEEEDSSWIFPNPSYNYIYLKKNVPTGSYLKIFNTGGQQVMQTKIVDIDQKIDISLLQQGVYAVEIEGSQYTGKIIKK